MSRSNSLLPNKYYNKLFVNRLETIDLKYNSIKENETLLFSMVINSSSFDENSNILSLTIQENIDSMITFTDRPIRNYNVDNNIINTLQDLFSTISSFNSDPPNGIIILDNKQYPYTFELNNIFDNIIEFKLIPLTDKQQNIYLTLNSYNNKNISIFFDSEKSVVNALGIIPRTTVAKAKEFEKISKLTQKISKLEDQQRAEDLHPKHDNTIKPVSNLMKVLRNSNAVDKEKSSVK